jgi:hypothetical protein
LLQVVNCVSASQTAEEVAVLQVDVHVCVLWSFVVAVEELYAFFALTEKKLNAKCEGHVSTKQLRGPASISITYRRDHTANWSKLFLFLFR